MWADPHRHECPHGLSRPNDRAHSRPAGDARHENIAHPGSRVQHAGSADSWLTALLLRKLAEHLSQTTVLNPSVFECKVPRQCNQHVSQRTSALELGRKLIQKPVHLKCNLLS